MKRIVEIFSDRINFDLEDKHRCTWIHIALMKGLSTGFVKKIIDGMSTNFLASLRFYMGRQETDRQIKEYRGNILDFLFHLQYDDLLDDLLIKTGLQLSSELLLDILLLKVRVPKLLLGILLLEVRVPKPDRFAFLVDRNLKCRTDQQQRELIWDLLLTLMKNRDVEKFNICTKVTEDYDRNLLHLSKLQVCGDKLIECNFLHYSY